MSREDVIRDEQIRRLRTQLPDFMSTRAMATRAVVDVAEEIRLELSEADVRSLALAVVDAIEKGTELRGIEFAYGLIDREVNDAYRTLISPATEKAAIDPEHRKVLAIHHQYVSGMVALRRRLGDTLLGVANRWLGIERPAIEAPPVVPLPGPAGAAEARERVAVRAGVA